ncbi:hypothetical protein L1049_013670 [Liquidambar formosana]|uniref:Uncharacterized protein n=1 Tax=Liquidambar formosana TaxID=63359 RepID=A0AAP0WX20_LIQFO
MTTNTESLETTKAPSDLNFLSGWQLLVRGHQLGMPQPQLWQQSGFDEVQFLQLHIMFKELQECEMSMNREKHGASPAVQGVPNGFMFSQDQGQTSHSMVGFLNSLMCLCIVLPLLVQEII